jgi:hypothetical protein
MVVMPALTDAGIESFALLPDPVISAVTDAGCAGELLDSLLSSSSPQPATASTAPTITAVGKALIADLLRLGAICMPRACRAGSFASSGGGTICGSSGRRKSGSSVRTRAAAVRRTPGGAAN